MVVSPFFPPFILLTNWHYLIEVVLKKEKGQKSTSIRCFIQTVRFLYIYFFVGKKYQLRKATYYCITTDEYRQSSIFFYIPTMQYMQQMPQRRLIYVRISTGFLSWSSIIIVRTYYRFYIRFSVYLLHQLMSHNSSGISLYCIQSMCPVSLHTVAWMWKFISKYFLFC